MPALISIRALSVFVKLDLQSPASGFSGAGNKLWEWASFGRYGTGGFDVHHQVIESMP